MDRDTFERDAESFFAKWAEAWPAALSARLFASEGEWPPLRARVGTLFEIAEACWVLRDATVRAHKLSWWLDELRQHAEGRARHPLLLAAPELKLSTRMVEHALRSLDAATPSNSSQTLTRIQRLAENANDAPTAVAAMQAMSAAMFLLALREGQPSAFAHAPLDLRARHAVAGAETGVALDALVATLALAWRDELRARFRSMPRASWHGQRGLRVLNHAALGVIDALAAGRGVPSADWRSTFAAWSAVAGLR
ncbi:MAG TPA: hypothetical protein VN581_03710 [Patescibacteria group bacterium]|nr:hypothetical protein [Patescibacteria group bacterium]